MTITDQLTTDTCTVSQIKKALAHYSVMQSVSDAVTQDVTQTVNIMWNSGITFERDDALYAFIKSTLSYTDAQMTTLIDYARTQAE